MSTTPVPLPTSTTFTQGPVQCSDMSILGDIRLWVGVPLASSAPHLHHLPRMFCLFRRDTPTNRDLTIGAIGRIDAHHARSAPHLCHLPPGTSLN